MALPAPVPAPMAPRVFPECERQLSTTIAGLVFTLASTTAAYLLAASRRIKCREEEQERIRMRRLADRALPALAVTCVLSSALVASHQQTQRGALLVLLELLAVGAVLIGAPHAYGALWGAPETSDDPAEGAWRVSWAR